MSDFPAMTEAVAIPPHVPAELVYDFDYVADPSLDPDPHAGLAELARKAPPIFFTPRHGGHWICRSYREAFEISRNTELFSSHFTARIPKAEEDTDMFPISSDPPEHGMYRKTLNPLFGPQAMNALGGSIRDLAVELIEAVRPRGRCDFIAELAEPVPVTVFLKLMGMPVERQREFRDLAIRSVKANASEEFEQTLVEINAINDTLIEQRQDGKGDDVISRMWRTGFGGRRPTFHEMQAICVLLFTGGLDTVVNALGFGALHMARDQELQALLRAEPERIPEAAEEFLRLRGIAQTARLITTDTDYQGVHGPIPVRKDEMMLILVSAANLDPEVFPDPQQVKFGRESGHMTFSTGIHRCLGSHLARIEIGIVYEELLRRLPPFFVDEDYPPVMHAGRIMGIDRLHLKWDARGAEEGP